MPNKAVAEARGMLRNSAALLLVGVLNKGMGLVIVVLVARFLGPEATGLFAQLFSIALLLENITALGLQDTLVREVAAHPDRRRSLFLQGTVLVTLASILPSLAFLGAYVFVDRDESTTASLLILAISTPLAAIHAVALAALQGAERVLWITWATFTARVVSTGWLVWVLFDGAGVEAAFQSRLLLLVIVLAALLPGILRGRDQVAATNDGLGLARRSVPFALNRALFELTSRSPVLITPFLLDLRRTGIFDAADRIGQTLAMTVSVGMVGIMPAFVRGFAGDSVDSAKLVAYSVKYTCLGLAVIATGVSVGAGWIIQVLYGDQFAEAVIPLQLMVWARVIMAADAVLKQAMLAAHREYAVVARSFTGLCVLLPLVVVLGHFMDITGVAVAVILTALVALALDVTYVRRQLVEITVVRSIVLPLVASALVAVLLLSIDGKALVMRLVAAAAAWLVLLLVFQLLPASELRFFRDILRRRSTH